jgi:hypothetical protein
LIWMRHGERPPLEASTTSLVTVTEDTSLYVTVK